MTTQDNGCSYWQEQHTSGISFLETEVWTADCWQDQRPETIGVQPKFPGSCREYVPGSDEQQISL